MKKKRKPLPSQTKDIPAGMHRALVLLLQAYDYAREVPCPAWDLAVEIDSLRRAGLTGGDVRWLIGKGYVAHGIETTRAGADRRSFRRAGKFAVTRKTCLVLTEAGARAARRVCSRTGRVGGSNRQAVRRDSPETLPANFPHWNEERRELWVHGRMVKRFKQPAPDQETILSAFEEEGWPCRIDDPLPGRPDRDPKRHLHDTINNLNRHQQQPLIHFQGDGSGRGVRWEFLIS